MTLSDLSDDVDVSIDFVFLIQRLTQARDNKDVATQAIINRAIQRLNNSHPSDNLPFEPIMSVGEAKEIYPDYAINPPPLRVFKSTTVKLI